MNFFRLFHTTPQTAARPARDNDGRFLPQRLAVRRKALEIAKFKGRDDLVARLQFSGEN